MLPQADYTLPDGTQRVNVRRQGFRAGWVWMGKFCRGRGCTVKRVNGRLVYGFYVEYGDEVKYVEVEVDDDKWETEWAPHVVLNGFREREIINLNNDLEAFESDAGIEGDADSSVPVIKTRNSEGPYWVRMQRKINLGLGPQISANYTNQGEWSKLTATLGFAPMGGQDSVSIRLAKTYKEAKKINQFKVPSKEEDLTQFGVGEKLTWTSQGGALLMFSPAYSLAYAGLSSVVTGLWTQELEKLDDSRWFLGTNNAKVSAATAFTGTVIANVNLTKARTSTSEMNFLFDDSDARAKAALMQAIAGNFVPALEMSREESPYVTHVKTTKTRNNARVRAIHLGVPYLNKSWTKGKQKGEEWIEFHPDGSQSNVVSATEFKSRAHKYGPMDEQRTVAFLTNHHVTVSQDGSVKDGYSGQLVYEYSDEQTQRDELQRVIEKVQEMTGLEKETRVEFNGEGDKLGFTKLRFSIDFSQAAINKLLEERADLARIAGGFYVAEQTRRTSTNLCLDLQENPESDCVAGSKKQRKKLKKIEEEAEVARALLVEMKSSLLRKQRKEFVAKFAKLGKKLMENRYVFQSAFNIVKDQGVNADYSIKGAKISSFEATYRWQLQK
jgi:hypothetical protein